VFALLTMRTVYAAPRSAIDTIPDNQIVQGVTAGDLKKAAIIRLERDNLRESVEAYKTDVSLLNARISNLEGQLQKAAQIDSLNAERVQLLKDQIQLAKDTRADYELKIKGYEKELRKARRATFWASVAGVLGTVAGFFLFITK
jgi:chromosome segregation ATPase